MRFAIDEHGPAQRRRVAAEAPLPESIAQNDQSGVRTLLLFRPRAADDRPPEERKGPRRRECAGNAFGIAVAAKRPIARPKAVDRIHQPKAAFAEADKDPHAQRIALAQLGGARRLQREPHEAIRLRVRQRAEHRGVDDGHDRGRRPDHEGEGEHRHDGVGRPRPQSAQCVADVAGESVEHKDLQNRCDGCRPDRPHGGGRADGGPGGGVG